MPQGQDRRIARERPENGGIVWHARANTFECKGCGEFQPQHRGTWMNPERLAMVRELVVLDHTECWEYDDPRMAKLARKFRKRVKQQMLLAARGENVTGLSKWESVRQWLLSWMGTRQKGKAAEEKQILALRELNSALVKKGLRQEARIGRLEGELQKVALWGARRESLPDLTPAEIERLAILAEECGEVVQAVGKVLRFGWESSSPYGSGRPNRSSLEHEIGNVRAIVNLMLDADDLSLSAVQSWQGQKRKRLPKWTLHQADSTPRDEQLAMMRVIASEQR